MIKLERRDHGAALGLYREAPSQFPLIGAVLQDEQEGTVYVDDPLRLRVAYVEHAFGFAQLLGEPTRIFESALERHLLIEKTFVAPKIRLYTPRVPSFLAEPQYETLRSWRQRFVMDPATFRAAGRYTPLASAAVVEIDEAHTARMEEAFGVMHRFWRNASDFARKAHAVMVLHAGQPASLCYAAALVDGEAEIDVLTRPEHQRLGLGRIAVTHFVGHCLARGLSPLWDCFANNAGSMHLSRAVGFSPRGEPYPFFTINR